MHTPLLPYQLADVFTDRTYGGNPLAVFDAAPALSDAAMQTIARELNLSETVFVRPPRDPAHACALRIFTPASELPFAGHPTVGSAIVLAQRGHFGAADATGLQHVVVEEGVGPIAIDIHWRDGVPVFARFRTARLPECAPAPLSRAALAAILSLNEDAVLEQPAAQMASCGVPFLCVALRDRTALAQSRIDNGALARLAGAVTAPKFYVYAANDAGTDLDYCARMYAPSIGIAEDAATGAAAAALAGVLAQADPRRDGRLRWTLAQGVEMGRPSRIDIEVEKIQGAIAAVYVGGSAVIVGNGHLRAPDLRTPD